MINIKEDESMKAVMRRIVSILTVIAVMTGTGLLTGCAVTAVVNDNAGPAYNAEASGVIDGWKPDSPAMLSIVEFVRDSVDETSDAYIPVEDRIAVFDMDGTLYGERFPTYFNDWLYIQRALYDEDRGIVKVTDIKAEDYPAILPILPEGAYHIYDYQFFYRNLQENVKLRVERYFTANT